MKSNEVDNEIISVLSNTLKNYVNDKNIAIATNNTDVADFCETRIVEICSYLNKNDYLEDVRDALKDMPNNQIVKESLKTLKIEEQAQTITQAVRDTKATTTDVFFDNSKLVESLSKVSNDDSLDIYNNLNTKANLPSFKNEKELLNVASSSVAVYFYNDLKNMDVELEEENLYIDKIVKFFDNPNAQYGQENYDTIIPTDNIEQ